MEKIWRSEQEGKMKDINVLKISEILYLTTRHLDFLKFSYPFYFPKGFLSKIYTQAKNV